MSKKLIAALACLSVAGLSGAATAADGTLTFEGLVNAKTCTLEPSSASQLVTLQPVNADLLQGAGKVAGSQNFTLNTTGCDANAMVAAVFATGGNVDPATGNLNNTIPPANGGTNAQVALFRADGTTKIDLSDISSSGGYQVESGADGKASLGFVAKYAASSATTTPGVLKTNLQYTMSYQ